MLFDRDDQKRVAKELEEWQKAIPGIIDELRMGHSSDLSYSFLYQLRWELGRIMARSGHGGGLTPKPVRDQAQEILDAYRW